MNAAWIIVLCGMETQMTATSRDQKKIARLKNRGGGGGTCHLLPHPQRATSQCLPSPPSWRRRSEGVWVYGLVWFTTSTVTQLQLTGKGRRQESMQSNNVFISAALHPLHGERYHNSTYIPLGYVCPETTNLSHNRFLHTPTAEHIALVQILSHERDYFK